jgi:hypothetical protein
VANVVRIEAAAFAILVANQQLETAFSWRVFWKYNNNRHNSWFRVRNEINFRGEWEACVELTPMLEA